jgi:DNA-binding transcriptional LysR family regulator
MELRQLTVFVAVAEEASFTRAADRLHMVQSAVSASVRALERDLGTALFDRTTRRVELTDAGAALFERLRAVALAHDAKLRSRMTDAQTQQLGELLDRLLAGLE